MIATSCRSLTKFRQGDLILVQPDYECPDPLSQDWWLGWIVKIDSARREPKAPVLFQVADCDSGDLFWVSAKEATRLVLRGLNFDNVIPLF